MALIDDLKSKYFFNQADITEPNQSVPLTAANSHITPFVGGKAYFANLNAALAQVKTALATPRPTPPFVYIAGWWVDLVGGEMEDAATGSASAVVTLCQESQGIRLGTSKLIDDLGAIAAGGADVRVLGWISPLVMTSTLLDIAQDFMPDVNSATLHAIHAARQKNIQALGNVIGHPVGAVHTKLVLIGIPDATQANEYELLIAYTGGIDLARCRNADYWQDVQARVEGKQAVGGLHKFYREMWNEVMGRKSHKLNANGTKIETKIASNTSIAVRNIETDSTPPQTTQPHHVQILRTLPLYDIDSCFVDDMPPLSFAQQGMFEIRNAWKKAISGADNYIYIEDQGFWSLEVMQWLNDALKNKANLHVILVTGLPDPTDPEADTSTDFRDTAIKVGLFKDLDASQTARIAMFERKDTFVHSKTTLIDDHWAIIGSANCMRRSLYTDIENSIAVLDENDQFVRDYRVQLWGKGWNILNNAAQMTAIADIDKALRVWNSNWGIAGAGVTLAAEYKQFMNKPSADDTQGWKYNRFYDADSRQEWSII